MSIVPNDRLFFNGTPGNFNWYDVQVYSIRDDQAGQIGFITEYPNNRYIEKTETIGYRENHNADYQPFPGKITVYLRSGETYTFSCWACSAYCGQFGIRVSDVGTCVYIISRLKGLWCYTIQGVLLWKTRLTTVSHVFPHPDNSLTCITSSKLILMSADGKTLRSQKVLSYEASKISPNLISALTGENTLTIIDSTNLSVLQRISLCALSIYRYTQTAISTTLIAVIGHVVVGNEVIDGDRVRPVTAPVLFILNRATSQLLRQYFLSDYGLGLVVHLAIHGNTIHLNGFSDDGRSTPLTKTIAI